MGFIGTQLKVQEIQLLMILVVINDWEIAAMLDMKRSENVSYQVYSTFEDILQVESPTQVDEGVVLKNISDS